MELLFSFEGVKLSSGQFPRLLVEARYSLEDVPNELANLKITFSLPISRSGLSLEQSATRALEAARSMLNPELAEAWMAKQSAQPAFPRLTNPPDAGGKLDHIPMPDE